MSTLADLGEFGLIARIERLAGRRGSFSSVPLGIGDDAALLRTRAREDVVVTTDAFVESVHFRWSSQSPGTVGRRLLRANLSDLAAMGARPLGCLLSLAAPPTLAVRRLDGLVRGLLKDAAIYRCPLVGGNVARARQTVLSLTVIGAVARGRALRRAGVRPGDRICVTGSLGGAALALARSERGGGPLRALPEPRLSAGRALARLPATGGCIDVSDGIAADLGHLLEASGLGADLDAGSVPRPRGFDAACRRLRLDSQVLALAGGEDYELLFSVRPGGPGDTQLSRRLGVAVTEVGRATRRRGLRGLPRLAATGWQHFEGSGRGG